MQCDDWATLADEAIQHPQLCPLSISTRSTFRPFGWCESEGLTVRSFETGSRSRWALGGVACMAQPACVDFVLHFLYSLVFFKFCAVFLHAASEANPESNL